MKKLHPIENFIKSEFPIKGLKIDSLPISQCEKVKEYRGNIIANVSHDLRTPLQSIIGYSETLINKKDQLTAEQQTKYLEIILSNGQRLSTMIDQFFEFSKLEVSESVLNRIAYLPDALAVELNENYRFISGQRGINLTFDIEENLPHMCVDYPMMYRVFQNLIDNALKFTPEGGEVNVKIQSYSDKNMVASITDTGNGIPKDELDSIFKQFKTAHITAHCNEKNDGLGLGLAIVNKILHQHDSVIFVDSNIGKGSTFTFFLPMHFN